jgi:hypothetical protein
MAPAIHLALSYEPTISCAMMVPRPAWAKGMVTLEAKEAELTKFVARGGSPGRSYDPRLPAERGPSPLVLWDLTGATLVRVRAEDVLSWQGRGGLARGRRSMGRSAFVCGRPVDFGLARMWTTYLSLNGYPRSSGLHGQHSGEAWLLGGDD